MYCYKSVPNCALKLKKFLAILTVAAAGGSATTSEFLSSVVNLIVLLHDSIIRSAARVPLDFVSLLSEFLPCDAL